MKVAVIGCGTIANSAHIPSYMKNPTAEIKYFCDIIPERAAAAVEKYGCGTAVVDYKEVLADPEVEAVSVCTPNNMHPVITFHGAWAQNIGENEMYIDFMGDKGGIRLKYGADFTVYTAKNGSLISYKPEFNMNNHFENEINRFIECIQTGEKLPSHIDTVVITAKMMQAIYDSAETHSEIKL